MESPDSVGEWSAKELDERYRKDQERCRRYVYHTMTRCACRRRMASNRDVIIRCTYCIWTPFHLRSARAVALTAPMVQYLVREMKERGCELPERFVRCIPRPGANISGAFHVETRKVSSSRTLLRPEAVHHSLEITLCTGVFEQCGNEEPEGSDSNGAARVDPCVRPLPRLFGLQQLPPSGLYRGACGRAPSVPSPTMTRPPLHPCQIRAANLSDDCAASAEWGRGNYAIRGQHKRCVQRRAAISIRGFEACSGDKKPEQVIASVFRRCYRDTAPFPGTPE